MDTTTTDLKPLKTTGQRARISSSIIAGQPLYVREVDVIAIDGDTLTYTVDRVWFSTATRTRDDRLDWELIETASEATA